MKRSISLALLVALLTLCLGGAAIAATKYSTGLSVAYAPSGGGKFSGKVSSPRKACIAGRRVTVRRIKPGKDPAVGSATSTGAGKWLVNPPGTVAAGDYYAVTPGAKLAGGAGTCTSAKPVYTHVS